jgi:hypothetical protein
VRVCEYFVLAINRPLTAADATRGRAAIREA